MSNQFCRYLSNGYTFSFDPSGSVRVKPCCWFGDSIPLDSELSTNRKIHFESITDWTHNCQSCRVLEQSGQQSLRQTDSHWIQDGHISQQAVTVDIQLDTQCNAACVICGDHSSSLWQKENAKLAGKKIKIHSPDHTVNRAIADIVQTVDLNSLTYVKFFGGEPLFTDTHLKFITHIPNPDNVVLHYTSNGSIYPRAEIIETWKKFKTVIFAASLDGVEQQFDYVRWPLSWSKVSDNLLRLKHNTDIWNLLFRVEFTANWINAYYYQELENWVRTHFDTNWAGDKTEINIHTCVDPAWGLELMPWSIRQLVLQRYPHTHIIHNLVKGLSEPVDQHAWRQFVTTWDRRRNNNWTSAFPDICKNLT